MTLQPNAEPVALAIARRELAGRMPFFARLWDLAEISATPVAHAPGSPSDGSSAGLSRKELAERAPFFLRVWLLREQVDGKDFPTFGADLHTLPLGSQYSDPLCDVGSSDIQVF
jgi:hypothetical protein